MPHDRILGGKCNSCSIKGRHFKGISKMSIPIMAKGTFAVKGKKSTSEHRKTFFSAEKTGLSVTELPFHSKAPMETFMWGSLLHRLFPRISTILECSATTISFVNLGKLPSGFNPHFPYQAKKLCSLSHRLLWGSNCCETILWKQPSMMPATHSEHNFFFW